MIKVSLVVVVACVFVSSAFSQNIAPTLSVDFTLGWGCNYIAESNGTDAVGTTSCDNWAATTFWAGGFDWSGDLGSYCLGFCGMRNGDRTYSPFGPTPILPYRGSSDCNWIVGGYDYIYHNGEFFDGSGGVRTQWNAVMTNAKGDAFVLGNTAGGPILAKFRGTDNMRLFVRNGIGGSAMTRDKGGNIYILNNGQLTKYAPDATKVVYAMTLPAPASSIYVDAYSQVYLTGKTGNGLATLYAPQPVFGGETDAFLTVLNPTGKRIVYSSYVGGKGNDYSNGVSADQSGNAHIAGTDESYEWDGRPWCDPGGGANCSEMFYVATFGPFRNSSVPDKLKFGSRQVGTTTKKKLLFKNLGNVPLNVSSVQVSGSEYAQFNTCNAPIKPDKTCAITVSFTPFSSGEHNGSMVVVSDSLTSPQQVALSGSGR